MESSVEIFASFCWSHRPVASPAARGLGGLPLPAGLGTTGAFADGFLHLGPASIIIAFHNVWSGIPVLLTLLGWSFLISA